MLALLIFAVALMFACRHALLSEVGLRQGNATVAARQRLTLESAAWAAAGLAAYALAALLGAPIAGAPVVAPCLVMALGATARLLLARA